MPVNCVNTPSDTHDRGVSLPELVIFWSMSQTPPSPGFSDIYGSAEDETGYISPKLNYYDTSVCLSVFTVCITRTLQCDFFGFKHFTVYI